MAGAMLQNPGIGAALGHFDAACVYSRLALARPCGDLGFRHTIDRALGGFSHQPGSRGRTGL